MIRGVHHVAIHARDLDRMIQFYRNAFGFEVVGEPFEWDHVKELDQILLTIPLQVLAYHAALHLGHDIDKPRNLAKSVTVE